jgi:hypothetical protein
VHRRAVLEHLHRAVPATGAGRQRHDAVAAGPVDVGDAEDPVEVAGARQPGAVGRAVQVGVGGAPAGQQRGLHQPDQAEVDEVDQRCDVGGGDALGAALLAPVAEERVPFGGPQQRADAGLLQGGGQGDHGVQAGADPPVEDVAGGAHLLPDVGPGGRGSVVADGAAVHRLGERGDDLVDPLRAGLVALHRPAAGALLEQVGGLADERGHRRVVGQHVRGEHLQRQRHGGGQPLVGGQHLHRDGGAPTSSPSTSRSISIEPGRCSSICSIAAGSMTRSTSLSTVVRPASRSTSSSTGLPIGPSASHTPTRTVAPRTARRGW